MAIAELKQVSFKYAGSDQFALHYANFQLNQGITLVAGDSGSGKSTLLRLFNGLIPQFYGGTLRGGVLVNGKPINNRSTSELAQEVAFVFQDPEQQSVYDQVETDIAFGLENLGLARPLMRERVDETMARLNIDHLRGRKLATLSGGERQKVAIAGVLALKPRLIALDEPTSQLDHKSSRQIVDTCQLLREQGTSLVISEHRLDRLLPIADQCIIVDHGKALLDKDKSRDLLGTMSPTKAFTKSESAKSPIDKQHRVLDGQQSWSLDGVTIGYQGREVLSQVNLHSFQGEVIVLIGPNGGGKTTLLRAIAGLQSPFAGKVERAPRSVAYLPQNPAAVLHRPTLGEEINFTLRYRNRPIETPALVEMLGLTRHLTTYPGDLSSGQRQRGAIATILAGDPQLILLDEPTRGMDKSARRALIELVQQQSARGHSTVIATHDLQLANAVAGRIIRVERGRVKESVHFESELIEPFMTANAVPLQS